MDHDLRQAIQADPTNRDLRLELAERWAARPEAELIHLLLDERQYENLDSIRTWFERHEMWPALVRNDLCDHTERRDYFDNLAYRDWLDRAFNRERWPDQDLWRAAVLAVVNHVLPDAQANLSRDYEYLKNLEAIEPALTTDPLPPTELRTMKTGALWIARLVDPASEDIGPQALAAGRACFAAISTGPGESFGEVTDIELIKQYQILGWSWLGLPPVWKSVVEECNHEATLHRHATPTTESPAPRDRHAAIALCVVLGWFLIIFLSIWLSMPYPRETRSWLIALVATALMPMFVLVIGLLFALLPGRPLDRPHPHRPPRRSTP